ncbi:MAG: carboxypeptidase, partial [Variovorax sp.]
MPFLFQRSLLAALLGTTLLAPPTFAQQKRDNALFDAATAEQPAVIKTLEKLVNIETGTGDAEGMAAAGKYLEDELKALGFTVTRSKS